MNDGSGKSARAGTGQKRNAEKILLLEAELVQPWVAVLDTKNKVKDKATAVKENIKDMPTQTAYAVHSAKEKAKANVSDFKRGIVQGAGNQTERACRQAPTTQTEYR